jgi:hypothetical protein
MRKTNTRKLTIRTETVIRLVGQQLANVAGGGPSGGGQYTVACSYGCTLGGSGQPSGNSSACSTAH